MSEASANLRRDRLVPELPFPPYAHIPGLTPHPVSDPRGHSFGHRSPPPDALEPERWQDCRNYLFGLDLFNHGYYWEAHEAWESLWHVAGRAGPTADFLKGLIKLAAAGVKNLEGKPAGVASHAGRAMQVWQPWLLSCGGELGLFLGLQCKALVELAESITRQGWPKEPPVLCPQFPPT